MYGSGWVAPHAGAWFKDGKYHIAQCLEVDVASHGRTIREALDMLSEALELHFEDPTADIYPEVWEIEVLVGRARDALSH